MAFPSDANTVILYGSWYDHLNRSGMNATITATPLPAGTSTGTATPNLVDAANYSWIKSRQWTTQPLASGLYALPLLGNDDPDLTAFGGYRIDAQGESSFIVNISVTASTITVTQQMADAIAQASTMSGGTFSVAVGDTIQAVHMTEAAVLSAPAPTPPAAFLTAAQTNSVIATAVGAVRQVPDPTGVPTGQVVTRTSGGVAWQAPTGGGGSGPAVYAPAPSGSDDLAALAAALPAKGTLRLRAGTYRLSGTLAIGDGQDLMGEGGNLVTSATTLLCTAAGAGVSVTEQGGITGNLLVDGNKVATAPFKRLLGVNGAQRTFFNVSVVNSAQDNVYVQGAQNDTWLGCNIQEATRDNLVLDNGAGGISFLRCEFNGAGRYHLRSDNQVSGGPYVVPTDNVFDHCIFERENSTSSACTTNIYLNAFDALVFTDCTIFAGSGATGPRVDVIGAGTVTFEGGRFQGVSSSSGTGMRVANGARVVMTRQPRFENLANGINLVSGNPYVNVIGDLFFNNVATRYTGSGTPDVSVHFDLVNPLQVFRESSTDKAIGIYVRNESGVRLLFGADGSVGFNDGVGYTAKATLAAAGPGVLALQPGAVFRGGYGPTSSRPTASAAGTGAYYFDTTVGAPVWSDGASWKPSASVMPYTAQSASATLVVGQWSGFDTTAGVRSATLPLATAAAVAANAVTQTSWDSGTNTLTVVAGSRTDTGGTTSGSATVTDTAITAADNGRAVSGTGIPAGSYVGTVTAGTSFLLSSSPSSQVNVIATATAASVALTVSDLIYTPAGPVTSLVVSLLGEVIAFQAVAVNRWRAIYSQKSKSSLDATYGAILNTHLLAWAYAQAFRLVSATRDANEAITTASIVWPDGSTGTFTTTTASTSFPGAIDAYSITYVPASGSTKTVTQSAVTRDSAGAVTAQPALAVA